MPRLFFFRKKRRRDKVCVHVYPQPGHTITVVFPTIQPRIAASLAPPQAFAAVPSSPQLAARRLDQPQRASSVPSLVDNESLALRAPVRTYPLVLGGDDDSEEEEPGYSTVKRKPFR